MKKLFLTLATITLIFTACSSDNGGGTPEPKGTTVTASSVAGATTEITTVKAVNSDDKVIATGTFKDGGFSITLPATLDASMLQPMFSGKINGVYVSANDAKGTWAYFRGYAGNRELGIFALYNYADGNYQSFDYLYIDRDLRISGSYSASNGQVETYDMKLNKGWNKVLYSYNSSTKIVKYTFPTPAGTDAGWIFSTRL